MRETQRDQEFINNKVVHYVNMELCDEGMRHFNVTKLYFYNGLHGWIADFGCM